MLINKANLESLFTNLKTTFNKAFAGRKSTWQRIAMKVTSTSSQNDYAWLSKFPKMRKWVGEKQVKNLAGHKYTVVNDDYEATVEVDRNDIEDDNLGIYGPQAMAAGESAADLPDDIVNELLINGHQEECFDGQYFFDSDHPSFDEEGEEITVSNTATRSLSAASQAAAKAGYGQTRTDMQKTKDEEGRNLGVKPNVLVVGPNLEDTARALLTNDRLEDGKPNLYKGTAELVVIADITDDSWFLLDTTRPVKPFIYQERKAPIFVKQTDMNADDVFSRKKYKFGAEARAAGGYGFWQLAFRNKPVS